MAQRRELFNAFGSWMWDLRGYSPRTRNKYSLIAAKCELWLISARHISLPYARLKDLQAFLFAQPPNARTRNNIRSGLVAFYDFLVETGRIDHNPAFSLPRLPEPRSLPKALSTALAAKVRLEAELSDSYTEVLALLLLYTGLRKSEARTLEWANIDLDAGWLRVKGKGDKTRDVPIHPRLKPILSGWLRECGDPRWVFPSPRFSGMPISETSFKDKIDLLGERVGVHLHPHLFRHTAATELYAQTSDIRLVQEFLGHADPKTTVIYTRVTSGRLQAAVGQMCYEPPGLPEVLR